MAVGIIYHGDPDGECSASIVCHYLDREEEVKRYLYKMDYGDDLPFFEDDVTTLYVLDIAFDPLTMGVLVDHFPVIWIDHHKTSIDKLKEFLYLDGIRAEGDAACTLTWEYLFPGEPEPLVSQLIADRDLWKFKLGDKTRNFYDYYLFKAPVPGDPTWTEWLSDQHIYDDLITGNLLRSARISRLEDHIDAQGVEIEADLEDAEGVEHHVKGLSVNVTPYADHSDAGEYILNGKGYAFAHIYYEGVQNRKKIRFNSLRGSQFNVRKFAESKGGGGHFRSAGFIEQIHE
jgi:oligoribonuclease NrnB/cAMP/cGMP phosphodiesterase (DHH superfamily)